MYKEFQLIQDYHHDVGTLLKFYMYNIMYTGAGAAMMSVSIATLLIALVVAVLY